MNKHTFGPWIVNEFPQGCITIEQQSEPHLPVCGIRFDPVINTASEQEEQRSNARLMAAAPELLESLSALMKRWELFTDEDERDGWGSMHDAYYDLAKHARAEWEAAKAALAKADSC